MFAHRNIQPKIKFLSADSGIAETLNDSVISFQVQKDMNQLAGAFDLTLVPRATFESSYIDSKMLSFLYKNIHPMDLISIGIESDGGIMLGIIDNVIRVKRVSIIKYSAQ